ncbi:guanine nucleotide-binding protein G(o) subunit alpha-like [Styela clava]|uniref:guanine nucleotide-binding protein G(t) subunit alpha-2-like n=1 Tax=Styela clava TaxID=7725 RepID=UPI001939ACBB|nr:guanine nucleotide-binding protein G(t) subunit alpha-2-like [Styela clava]
MSVHYRLNGWEHLGGIESHKKLDGTRNGIFKIPLLGAPGSGTKEIGRSLRTLYGKNTDSITSINENEIDVMPYKNLVHSNAFHTMLSLVEEVDSFGLECTKRDTLNDVIKVKSFKQDQVNQEIPREIWMSFKRIWEDGTFVCCAQHTSKRDLLEEAEYYFNNIDRISATYFEPSAEDVALCRMKLNSIYETKMRNNLWLLEVGPIYNKSNIKRVLQYFGDNTVVIFCVDVSSFDQFEDDGKTNKLSKTLEHFRIIANHEFTRKAMTILLFTKTEELEKKLKNTELKKYFVNYNGRNTVKDAVPFIRKKFEAKAHKRAGLCSLFISNGRLTRSEDLQKIRSALSHCVVQLRTKEMKLI